MDSIAFFIAPGLAVIGLSIGSYNLFRGITKQNKAYRDKGTIILILTIIGFMIYYTALIYIGLSIKGLGGY